MMRFRGFWKGALLLILGVFFVAGRSWAGTTGKLEGVITDSKTGKPVPFCNVTLPALQRGTTTDEKGYYFLINIPAGRYDVKVTVIGYEPIVRAGVTIIPDFTTQLTTSLNPTTATTLKETVITGERPLIQKDATGTTRIVTGEDLKALPTRGYRDAVANEAGVATAGKYSSDTEAQNAPSLYIRGGRSNGVSYYVDGFSTQDPLTGISTTSINQNAVEEVETITSGFNAEYGRVSSGIVNVITKEGGTSLKGSLETVTDYGTDKWTGARSYGQLTYNGSLSGPLLPHSDKLTFFLAGEVRNNRDRSPRPNIFSSTGEPISVGELPANALAGRTWQGKVAWRPDNATNVRLSVLGSLDNWQNFSNAYLFDSEHSPRYHDFSNTASILLNRTLNNRSFVSLGVSYNGNERVRGDGVYQGNVLQYSQNFAGPDSIMPNNPLYFHNDDFYLPGSVFDDFFHRKSSYVGGKVDYSDQINRHHTIKVGADIQDNDLKFYRHLFPTRLGTGTYENNDVVNYGFDQYGREMDFAQEYIDAAGVAYPVVTQGGANYYVKDVYGQLVNLPVPAGGKIIENINQAKKPIVASMYAQDKIEFEGLIANIGLRWDYLAPRTPQIANPTTPINPQTGDVDLVDAKASNKISPRLGVSFPVTDKTDFRFNYGLFYQLPDLEDLYTNYNYLRFKLNTGGYYYAFGNPNLEPERTTQMEVGFKQQVGDRSALDVAVWYKDIQGLVEVQQQRALPNQFATFRNTDFGTLRGVDLNWEMRRKNHVSGSASYTLSWAQGTGSDPQTQRNVAWVGSEEPKMISALNFDVRHKLNANIDISSDPAQPGRGWRNLFSDAGIDLQLNAQSGTPYTPVKIYDEVTQLAVTTSVIGDLNSRRLPWNITLDAKVHKSVALQGSTSLDLQLYVYNILNRYNATTVYLGTGDPFTTGYLNTADGQKLIPDGQPIYELAERDPLNFDNPRMVRFGAVLNF